MPRLADLRGPIGRAGRIIGTVGKMAIFYQSDSFSKAIVVKGTFLSNPWLRNIHLLELLQFIWCHHFPPFNWPHQ